MRTNVGRTGRRRLGLALLMLSARVWVIIQALALTVGISMGHWLLAPLLFALIPLLFPWTTARLVAVPLGLVKPAFWLGWWSHGYGIDRRRGSAAVAAAWALVRRPPADRPLAAFRWIERRLTDAGWIGAAEVAAAALVAAARADHDQARRLMDSVVLLPPKHAPSRALAIACEWRLAEAAARGDWPQVRAIGEGSAHCGRGGRLLLACAQRITGTRISEGALVWRWLWAPRRRHTWPMLARARAAPPPTPPAPARAASQAPLGILHAVLARAPAIAAAELEQLATAWQRTLGDPAVQTCILERAAVLGVARADRTLARLAAAIASDIALLARQARLPLAEGGQGILADAARTLREQLLGELELACDALAVRCTERRALPPLVEWREWLALRELHETASALGGLPLRRLAFPQLHPVVCDLAVWLWNERKQHELGGAMFRWLLGEALAVGDAEAIELQSRNAALGEN